MRVIKRLLYRPQKQYSWDISNLLIYYQKARLGLRFIMEDSSKEWIQIETMLKSNKFITQCLFLIQNIFSRIK